MEFFTTNFRLILNTFDQLKDNCEDFPDQGDILNCDFSKKKYTEETLPDFIATCASFGGVIQRVNLSGCQNDPNPNDFYAGLYAYLNETNFEFTDLILKEAHLKNDMRCVPKGCPEKMAKKMAQDDTFGLKRRCFKNAGPKKEFAYKKKKSGALETKPCNWLAGQKASKISKICKKSKYQIYSDGYLPASLMCPKTCIKNGVLVDHIEENPSAEFLFSFEINEKGNYVPITRRCGEIADMADDYEDYQDLYENVCDQKPPLSPLFLIRKYRPGTLICPESCYEPDGEEEGSD